MSDQAGGSTPAPIPAVKVVQDIPVLFADGVSSQSYGIGFSKFFLYRWDPDPFAKGTGTPVPILQVAMPTDGFVAMWLFFEQRIRMMVKEGALTQEDIDQKRQKLHQDLGVQND